MSASEMNRTENLVTAETILSQMRVLIHKRRWDAAKAELPDLAKHIKGVRGLGEVREMLTHINNANRMIEESHDFSDNPD